MRRLSKGLALVVLAGALGGCSTTTRWAELRARPFNPLTNHLRLDARGGPQPTPRTMQTLRRKNLASLTGDEALPALQEIAVLEPTADNVYAIAEVAYVQAVASDTKRGDGNRRKALNLYGTAVANAYFYLFDTSLQRDRNPFDPRFRHACDLYNTSLEKGLRYLQAQGALKPGVTSTIETDGQVFDVTVASRQTWHEQNFEELRFVSDFKVKELKNHFHQYGLGVPMIAVYKAQRPGAAADRFYPPGMTFPVTAFMRVIETTMDHEDASRVRHQCVIELHDPTVISHVQVGAEVVPLETDLTTPLAYALDNPAFRQANTPTRGLRNGESATVDSGLYMLEPFSPHKTPVVMVHGFWSSLVTWMDVFNDLRASPELRDHYQFWFYLYPTGQPFWYSAAHLRHELHEARRSLDPLRNAVALDQIVLVGHSMGGLLATMQSIESGDDFWRLVSERPLDDLQCSAATYANLSQSYYFTANPSVRRVITIATPFRGSNYSNVTTQWLGRKLINLPDQFVAMRSELTRNNPGYLPEQSLLKVTTVVESLDASSPVWCFLQKASRAPWVTYHNIIGDLENARVLGSVAGKSDGVVNTDSARCPYATSEIRVLADHTAIHRDPLTILEIRRILLEQLLDVPTSPNLTRLPELTSAMSGVPLPLATDPTSVQPLGQ